MARNNGNGTAVMSRGKSSRISSGTRGKGGKAKSGKRVYFFGKGKAEGGIELKELLGGKGANLADMSTMGLPVPPGFTITTETCADYYRNGQKLPRGLMEEVKKNLAKTEKATGKKFGNAKNPLLI